MFERLIAYHILELLKKIVGGNHPAKREDTVCG